MVIFMIFAPPDYPSRVKGYSQLMLCEAPKWLIFARGSIVASLLEGHESLLYNSDLFLLGYYIKKRIKEAIQK